jgi:hypothetical protein
MIEDSIIRVLETPKSRDWIRSIHQLRRGGDIDHREKSR